MQVLERLIQKEDLSEDTTKQVLLYILDDWNPAQMAALLSLLRAKVRQAVVTWGFLSLGSALAANRGIERIPQSWCGVISARLVVCEQSASFSAQGETADEIAGMAEAMWDRAVKVDCSPHNVVDIVGTGGDGIGSVNISTGASVIAAAAGARVAKHGSRASSSNCG